MIDFDSSRWAQGVPSLAAALNHFELGRSTQYNLSPRSDPPRFLQNRLSSPLVKTPTNVSAKLQLRH